MPVADKTLYLVRHGTTAANSADLLQGRTDHPLSPVGLAEAERIALHLRERNVEALFCSTMTRARQTAEAIGRACDLLQQPLAELVEIDLGEWEGRPYTDLKGLPDDFFARWKKDPALRIPGGESFLDVTRRVEAGLARVLAGGERVVVLVGHATVNRAALGVLLGMDPAVSRRFRTRNASLSEISLYREDNRWTAVVDYWNSAAHLEETK